MKFLGITRGRRFSPNMSEKDLIIMQMVSSELMKMGHQTDFVDEDDEEIILGSLVEGIYDAVYTMLRSLRGINLLRQFEERGILTVNSADGISNAGRIRVIEILSKIGTPIPKTLIVNQPEQFKKDFLNNLLINDLSFPCWIKKGEGWAQYPDDVMFVQNLQEAVSQFDVMCKRYPSGTIVLTEHLKGDLVKFYGVEGTDFFFWRYPDPKNSKFGLEAINGSPVRFDFDTVKLKQVCDKAALASKIIVYGGDCVVDADGSFRIIDFNDWPSFSACRNEASKAIAERILKLAQ